MIFVGLILLFVGVELISIGTCLSFKGYKFYEQSRRYDLIGLICWLAGLVTLVVVILIFH